RYLRRVDGTVAASFHSRLDSVIPDIWLDCGRHAAANGYLRLSATERDALTATIADLISLLERKEAQYTAAGTATDYAWACRAAMGARQVDDWLRQFAVNAAEDATALPQLQPARALAALNVRDRAQADNLEWIVRQEGHEGKILIFASRFHLGGAPLQVKSF